jgi:hypothetical protein
MLTPGPTPPGSSTSVKGVSTTSVGVMVSAGPADGLVFSMGATSLLESTCGQSYKTFYVRKLEMFVINWSACPMQAFPG